MKRWLAITALALLGGCASNLSPQHYSASDIGQVQRSTAGVVVGVRPVNVTGSRNGDGIGTVAGALAGGVGGSAIGGGSRAPILGAIGGALIGGLLGSAVESGATSQTGLEYIVQTANGQMLTLVQGTEPVFAVGQRVLVLHGAQSRLIADPRGNSGAQNYPTQPPAAYQPYPAQSYPTQPYPAQSYPQQSYPPSSTYQSQPGQPYYPAQPYQDPYPYLPY